MSDSLLTATLVFAGIIISSVVSVYVAGRRAKTEDKKNSGTVSTSDAAQLWEESNLLRKEYKERAEALEEQLKEVNSRLDEMTERLTTLQGSNEKMTKKIDELKKVILQLRAKNERLMKQMGLNPKGAPA